MSLQVDQRVLERQDLAENIFGNQAFAEVTDGKQLLMVAQQGLQKGLPPEHELLLVAVLHFH